MYISIETRIYTPTQTALSSKARRDAGPKMPARYLCLDHVEYERDHPASVEIKRMEGQLDPDMIE